GLLGVKDVKPANAAASPSPTASSLDPAQAAAATSVFPGQQSYQNCGVQSVRQIIEQSKKQCLAKTELEFLNDAIASGKASTGDPHPGESGGTSASGREGLLADAGVKSTTQKTTTENLAAALKDKKGVIAN